MNEKMPNEAFSVDLFAGLKPNSLSRVLSLEGAQADKTIGNVVALAFTNRTGSNTVGEHIRKSIRVGPFAEPLNLDVVSNWLRNRDVELGPPCLGEYVWTLSQKASGALGIKANVQQLRDLVRSGVANQARSFKVIHVKRRDSVAQAVSTLLAFETKAWTSFAVPEVGEEQVWYDFEVLSQIFLGIQRQNFLIEVLCDLHSIPRMEIVYEDFLEDRDEIVKRSRVFMALPRRFGPKTPLRHLRQESEHKRSMVAQFRKDLTRASLLP
jgi:trehalose 2-sulfotransferase